MAYCSVQRKQSDPLLSLIGKLYRKAIFDKERSTPIIDRYGGSMAAHLSTSTAR